MHCNEATPIDDEGRNKVCDICLYVWRGGVLFFLGSFFIDCSKDSYIYFPTFCLFVYLSVCLRVSICLSVCLSVCSVFISIIVESRISLVRFRTNFVVTWIEHVGKKYQWLLSIYIKEDCISMYSSSTIDKE